MTAPVYLADAKPLRGVILNDSVFRERGYVWRHEGDPPEGLKLKMSARAEGQLWERVAESAGVRS